MNVLFDNVSFSYSNNVRALRHINLSIAPGEGVAIIGENGAGKTTLVRHLNGLLKPTEGRVLIGEWDTQEYTVAQLARRVGYVFQNPDDQLFERTARAEIAFGPKNLGWEKDHIEASVSQALESVGLGKYADVHPYDLHISQRKLVAVAAALALQPPIIVLDEPTTGQDVPGTQLLGRIAEEQLERGHTVITITHDIDFCAEYFERVVVMAHAQILADGPAAEVLSQEVMLEEAGVTPPQVMRLAQRLGLSKAPRTVEEFVRLLSER